MRNKLLLFLNSLLLYTFLWIVLIISECLSASGTILVTFANGFRSDQSHLIKSLNNPEHTRDITPKIPKLKFKVTMSINTRKEMNIFFRYKSNFFKVIIIWNYIFFPSCDNIKRKMRKIDEHQHIKCIRPISYRTYLS